MSGERVCTKRGYGSVEAVRKAHRKASWRVRAYVCEDCGQYHATNHEKLRDRYEYDEDSFQVRRVGR
jgi:hypothetical protein